MWKWESCEKITQAFYNETTITPLKNGWGNDTELQIVSGLKNASHSSTLTTAWRFFAKIARLALVISAISHLTRKVLNHSVFIAWQ